jgi:hypothetical protein
MASTTIPSSGLSGNRHSGGTSRPWPGVSPCPETGLLQARTGSESPGAYRYDPSTYDPSVPDSDPRSPRYEPPHLRHQPGDTWVIDRNRPHDPLDPGPYGSPGWYPDDRTGRHRRGELPDDPEPEAPKAIPSPVGTAEERWPVRLPVGSADESRPIRPEFRPAPERKSVPPGFSDDPSPEEVEPDPSIPPRRYRWENSAELDQYNFGKLREEAWIGFLEGSQQFHDAHFETSDSLSQRFARSFRALFELLLRVLRFVGHSAVRAGAGTATTGMESRSTMNELEPISHRLTGRPRPKPSPGPSGGMGVNPGQGAHRTKAVGSFVLDWERHFDAAQAFREAVTL